MSLDCDIIVGMVSLGAMVSAWGNTIHKLTNQERDDCNMFLVLCHNRQLLYVNSLKDR